VKKPKQKSFFRFAQIDVFGAIVLCFVGTDLKRHERQFASFMSKFRGKRKPEYYWSLFRDFKEKAPEIVPPDAEGAVIAPGSDPAVPIIYVREYKPEILVHEIVHAVADIMRTYGLEDGEHSEVRAYMTDYLFQKFTEGIAV
jgi:hypothetical protein